MPDPLGPVMRVKEPLSMVKEMSVRIGLVFSKPKLMSCSWSMGFSLLFIYFLTVPDGSSLSKIIKAKHEKRKKVLTRILELGYTRGGQAALAQLVEQRTENPCVLGSIPRGGRLSCYSNVAGFFMGNYWNLATSCCADIVQIY